MRSITYLSSATHLMSVTQLAQLLQDSGPKNKDLGLTGMLLYRAGRIIQTIEGPDEAVQTVFDRIVDDPRHRDVFVLFNEPIMTRAFPDWTMGFRNFSDVSLADLDGYSTFLEDPQMAIFGGSSKPAYRMLELFKARGL